MQVFKFGGASVKNASALHNAVSIISSFGTANLLVVVSAMGKTTNGLEAVYNAFVSGDIVLAQSRLDEVKQYHFSIINEYFSTGGNYTLADDINNTFVEIEWLFDEDAQDDPDYLYDQIVSVGELASSKILYAALSSHGIPSHWADARAFIRTNANWREAVVDFPTSDKLISTVLPNILSQHIVVTQGFIGSTDDNHTTTLGREGSDYSAAIFAQALGCSQLTIWKDVPGVLNADPKWFDETVLIPHLSYHDAIELAYYGATVIHPKTIKPLQNKNITLVVRSFKTPDHTPSVINNESKGSENIPCFIFKVNQLLLSIQPKDFSFIVEDNLSYIFSLFHKHKIKVNTMLNTALSFSVCIDDDEEKTKNLINSLRDHFFVHSNAQVELVTIRHYNQQTINRVAVDKEILLEVKSRNTCQMVMRNAR